MSEWGVALYGDPCRECGFSWEIPEADAVALVAEMPELYAQACAGSDGTAQHPDHSWSVRAYVCHVADNLHIWAERLAGIIRGGPPEVQGYDENALAAARKYQRVAIQAALWSLERAAADWCGEVHAARTRNVVLVHPERGVQTLTDVVRSNAHDAFHHLWDVRQALNWPDGMP